MVHRIVARVTFLIIQEPGWPRQILWSIGAKRRAVQADGARFAPLLGFISSEPSYFCAKFSIKAD